MEIQKSNKGKLNLLYRDEVFKVVGAAYAVYNELGNGFLESVYEEALKIELSNNNIPFQSQVRLQIRYKGHVLNKEFCADLIVYDKIILELKATSHLSSIDEAQLINYLKVSSLPLGLLINFGNTEKLEWKRRVLTSKTI